MSLNIRSVTSNLIVFESTYRNSFDILALSETRATNDIIQLYKIDGYELFSQPRNRQGGGVILSNFTPKLIEDFCYTTFAS